MEMLHNVIGWAVNLKMYVLAAAAGGGLWASIGKMQDWISGEVELGIEHFTMTTKNPKALAVAAAVEQWIEDALPDAGDAKFAMAADLLIKEVPALAPIRSLIISLLTGIVTSVEKGVKNAEAKQAGQTEQSGNTEGTSAP